MSEYKYDANMRKGLSTLITKLFDLWGISDEQRLLLLGMNSEDHDALLKYKEGAPLPQESKILERVGWLLGIHKSLRLLFPRNENIRYTWVSRRNRDFNNKTPIDIMIGDGLEGILKVSRYLDHALF